MWSPWLLRSPSRTQSQSQSQSQGPKPKPKNKTFSCSSFKDIQTVIQEEQSEPDSDSEFGQLTPRRASIFHRVRISNSVLRLWGAHHRGPAQPQPPRPQPTLPDGGQGVVIFYTSLRVVRKTFEDCRAVRSILRSFRVRIDERDVSMDSTSLDELQRITGSKPMALPVVFVGGRCVGGAEEIRRLQESGELAGLIQRLPSVAAEHPSSRVCEACGGLRFVMCDECDGSHKVYIEKCGFRTCVGCNESGLIRCPSCSSTVRFNKHK